MLVYFTINTIAELICFFIALVCLLKDPDPVWRSQVWFLLITCVTELCGIYVKRLYIADMQHVQPNLWLYNILLIFQAGFISVMFRKLLSRRWLVAGGIGVLLVLYVYELFSHGIFVYNELTNTVMLIIFIGYSQYFFYRFLKDDAYQEIWRSAPFWWTSGVLFFYFGVTACNLFYERLHMVRLSDKHYLTYYIYNALNIILYGCWSYAFICRKWLTKTSPNSF